MINDVELVLRLLEASFLGGIIGYEREKYNKPAGLRTHMLVCLGTAMLIVYSENSFPTPDSWARVAAGAITGIGFLGAGTIMQSNKKVSGLTTAATVWTVAIIGMAVGGGQLLGAFVSTLLILGILYFSRIEETVTSVGLPNVTWIPLHNLPLLSKKIYQRRRKQNVRAKIQ
ncbi:MAG: MgtC/SapB family protein [Candidatus Micrarchaeota archaeon]